MWSWKLRMSGRMGRQRARRGVKDDDCNWVRFAICHGGNCAGRAGSKKRMLEGLRERRFFCKLMVERRLGRNWEGTLRQKITPKALPKQRQSAPKARPFRVL